jgi:hypothetical protein
MTTTTRFADALRGPPGRKSRRRKDLLPLIGVICGTLLLCTPLSAQDSKTEGEYEHPEHGNLAEIGAKLSNPVSDVWALFTEFDLNFSDGDINQGDAKVGGRMLFQPILPLPLFGEGDQQWKLITRPTVPILFSQPVPKGFDDFSSIGGIGGHPAADARRAARRQLDPGPGCHLADAHGDPGSIRPQSVGRGSCTGPRLQDRKMAGRRLPAVHLRPRQLRQGAGCQLRQHALLVHLQPAECLADRHEPDRDLRQQRRLRQPMERTRRAVRLEDRQGRQGAGQVPARRRVFRGESGHVRPGGTDQAQHHPGDPGCWSCSSPSTT